MSKPTNIAMAARPLKLRSFRRRMGLKQLALADRLGVDQATVSRWERGSSPVHDRVWRRLLDIQKAWNAAEFVPAPSADINMDKYWPALLKHYRAMRKISQEQLSQTLGYSAISVSRWEHGWCRPSLASQIRLNDIILSCVETDALLQKLIMQDSEGTSTLSPQ